MNINELDLKIKKDVEGFKEFVKSEYPECSKDPINSGDLAELGRQTYYALDSIRTNVIEYLKTNMP